MLIGIKTSDMKNFERVSEFVVKELKGTKSNGYISSFFTYYEINKIDSEQLKVLNYYLDKEIATFEIIEG